MEAGRTRPPNGAARRTPGASDIDSVATTACMVMAQATPTMPLFRVTSAIGGSPDLCCEHKFPTT